MRKFVALHSRLKTAPHAMRGFTLLEIVIALSIISVMMAMLSSAFGPYLEYKQRMDTKTKIGELKTALEAVYKMNAFNIDNTDALATDATNFPVATYGAINIIGGATPLKIETVCPGKRTTATGAAIGDVAEFILPTTAGVGVLQNLVTLQNFASRSINDLAKDGYNGAMCVLVSRRSKIIYEGAELFYHSVAIVSGGQNTFVEPNTRLVGNAATGAFELELAGDDIGLIMDGSKVAIENYKITKLRLDKIARAYETYFNIRYLYRVIKKTNMNFFYVDDGSACALATSICGESQNPADYMAPPNNSIWPSPTRATLGGTWVPGSFDNIVDTHLWEILGVNDTDLLDAWGNVILVDNRSSRVRSGKISPPFTATIGSLAPGAASCAGTPASAAVQCKQYITTTAMSIF